MRKYYLVCIRHYKNKNIITFIDLLKSHARINPTHINISVQTKVNKRLFTLVHLNYLSFSRTEDIHDIRCILTDSGENTLPLRLIPVVPRLVRSSSLLASPTDVPGEKFHFWLGRLLPVLPGSSNCAS